MSIEIKHRYSGKTILTFEGDTLQSANLRGADLQDANLRDADLRGADFRGVNLRGADLRGADLRGADLQDAYLRGVNLQDADLRGVNLRGALNLSALIAARTLIVSEGDIIGYKRLLGGTICKLLIPAAAKRSNATGRKCRAEFAVVLEGEGVSQHDSDFKYVIGATVRPIEPFCEDRFNECAPGIHFYLTRIEAENH